MITPEQLARSGSEHGEQAALFCWAATSGIQELKLLFAIPNGGFRFVAEASRLVAAGVRAGVPDTMLPVPMRGYHGLFIEMKRKNGKPSDVSDVQNKWIDALRVQGYYATVCYGWKQAQNVLLQYLGREQV